jgi:dihydrofolate reductase
MTAGSRPPIGLVWAEARGGVIGAAGGMPWHVPEDLAHFKAVTLGAPVIMGRKTWDSLPDRFRPLPGRANVVVTRQPEWSAPGAVAASSFDEALALAAGAEGVGPEGAGVDRVWVIGGGELFRLALPLADRLEVTRLDLEIEGDAFAPTLDDTWHLAHVDPAGGWHTSRSGIRYRFDRFTR